MPVLGKVPKEIPQSTNILYLQIFTVNKDKRFLFF